MIIAELTWTQRGLQGLLPHSAVTSEKSLPERFSPDRNISLITEIQCTRHETVSTSGDLYSTRNVATKNIKKRKGKERKSREKKEEVEDGGEKNEKKGYWLGRVVEMDRVEGEGEEVEGKDEVKTEEAIGLCQCLVWQSLIVNW